jgi:hypothetical protein
VPHPSVSTKVMQKASQPSLQQLESAAQTQASTLGSLQPWLAEASQQGCLQLPQLSASTSCAQTMSQPLWQHEGTCAQTHPSIAGWAQPALG